MVLGLDSRSSGDASGSGRGIGGRLCRLNNIWLQGGMPFSMVPLQPDLGPAAVRGGLLNDSGHSSSRLQRMRCCRC